MVKIQNEIGNEDEERIVACISDIWNDDKVVNIAESVKIQTDTYEDFKLPLDLAALSLSGTTEKQLIGVG